MLFSVMIDVAIGLILVYLLYSLLATIIGELISSLLGIRARLLLHAIKRMLNDNNQKETPIKGNLLFRMIVAIYRYIKSFFCQLFLKEPKGFKNSFAGKFYDYPLIKYLSVKTKTRRFSKRSCPSYISKETFSQTLIHLLRDKGEGSTDMEKVNSCLAKNACEIQPETLSYFRDLAIDAQGDIEKLKLKLEEWFESTMDRTTGWYKKRLNSILFCIGLVLAVLFNVDSIAIYKILAKDPNARNKMVDMSMAIVKDSSYKNIINNLTDSIHFRSLFDSSTMLLQNDINDANCVLGLGWKSAERIKDIDTAIKTSIFIRDTFLNPVLRLNDSINTLNKRILFDFNKGDSLRKCIAKESEKKNLLLKTINDSLKLSLVSINSVDTMVKNKTLSCIRGKCTIRAQSLDIPSILSQIKKSWSLHILGWLITALMISMGAPFWFDLLKKLINIRSAGVRPQTSNNSGKDEKAATKENAASNESTTNLKAVSIVPVQEEEAIDAAMRIYGDILKLEKGVITVAKGYLKSPELKKCIQVNVKDSESAAIIRNKYSPLKIGDNKFVDLKVVVTGETFLLSTMTHSNDRAIANQRLINGWGTIGCIVEKADRQKYILTCLHVLKGDYDWYNVSGKQPIINNKGVVISDSYSGYFDSFLDIAFAKISDVTSSSYISRYPNPVSWVDITEDDVYEKEVVIHGINSDEVNGLVVHDCWNDTFKYPSINGQIPFQLRGLIAISHRESDGSLTGITMPGDSGALVLDKDKKNAVGIVVAGDNEHTYAIKMSTILNTTGFTLNLSKQE